MISGDLTSAWHHCRSTRTIIPNPLVSRPRSTAGLWRVVALAAFFIVVAVLLSTLGDHIPPDLILVFLGLLAVVGVFCLFALAAGLFRFGALGDDADVARRAVVDSLPFGAVVTDREGKISYVNAHYGEFSGRRERWRAGVGAAPLRRRSPRPARRSTGCRAPPATAGRRARISASSAASAVRRAAARKPFWYRVGVRALPEVDGAGKPLVLWSGRGHHPRPRAAGQRLPRTAARHRLSRPRPRRLLLGRCRGPHPVSQLDPRRLARLRPRRVRERRDPASTTSCAAMARAS